MENQYIKFIEGNKESLNEAVRIAESLGYKEADISFEGTGILRLYENCRYFTTMFTESELQELGDTLYKDLTNIQIAKPQKPNKKKKTHKYFVFVEDTKAPKKIHEGINSAKKEAKRLARLTGKKTFICRLSMAFQAELKQINI